MENAGFSFLLILCTKLGAVLKIGTPEYQLRFTGKGMTQHRFGLFRTFVYRVAKGCGR
jgi:hypothetical protein